MNFDFLRLLLQNCWNCANQTWSAYTLCDACKQSFEQQVMGLYGYSLKVESLPLHFLAFYQYGVEEKLVLSLKGAKCSLVNFDYVAKILVEKMYLQGLSLKKVIWVTPESKHSLEIVKSINKITGLNGSIVVVRQTLKVDDREQKLKKRKERKVKAFDFIGESIDRSKNFIFIDDVVATGSTATAAWLALGRPALFQIWSITYRPRLAPASFV